MPSPLLTTKPSSVTPGDAESLAELLLVVYEELKQVAADKMRAERADHTLQPTRRM